MPTDSAVLPTVEDMLIPEGAFDYGEIAVEHRVAVHTAANTIKYHHGRAKEALLLIGYQLSGVKAILPHNQFGAWIHAEFDMSHRTAQNLMNVARVYGNNRGENISLFSPSVLYLLSGPTVTDEARDEAEQLAGSGTKIGIAEAKEIIARHNQATDQPIVYQADAFHLEGRKGTGPMPCSIEFVGGLPKRGQLVVYALIDPRRDKPYYVGATADFDTRMKQHAQLQGSDILNERKKEIYDAGLHTRAEILAYPVDYDEARELEEHYIRKFQDEWTGLRNIRSGGSVPEMAPPTPSKPAEPPYVTVWAIEQMIKDWLKSMEAEGRDVDAVLAAIKKLETNFVTDMLLQAAQEKLSGPYRKGDMIQALNNVRDQLRQAERQAELRAGAKAVYVEPKPEPAGAPFVEVFSPEPKLPKGWRIEVWPGSPDFVGIHTMREWATEPYLEYDDAVQAVLAEKYTLVGYVEWEQAQAQATAVGNIDDSGEVVEAGEPEDVYVAPTAAELKAARIAELEGYLHAVRVLVNGGLVGIGNLTGEHVACNRAREALFPLIAILEANLAPYYKEQSHA